MTWVVILPHMDCIISIEYLNISKYRIQTSFSYSIFILHSVNYYFDNMSHICKIQPLNKSSINWYIYFSVLAIDDSMLQGAFNIFVCIIYSIRQIEIGGYNSKGGKSFHLLLSRQKKEVVRNVERKCKVCNIPGRTWECGLLVQATQQIGDARQRVLAVS